ncbi:MAG: hypothetical protein ACOXZK_11050 [Bacteroidales bacterium]|jgi:hypothetical protein|nr:hypothetical protein [Bacteroidales bacterium]
MKKSAFIILFLSFLFCANAQQFGVGASAIYNFQSEGFGFGFRGNLMPNTSFSLVPQFSFYPSFNKVNEWILGLGAEFKIVKTPQFFVYGLAHAGYNSWKNFDESPMENAKKNNWNLEVGGGISTWHCLRPFLEWRYNVKFMESPVQLGVIYVFNCKSGAYQRGGASSGRGGWSVFGSRRRSGSCPAYGN